MAIGDVVITTAKKFKDSLHDQKGKIVGILSKQYKIEMLTGAALGEIKKFDKTAVRKLIPRIQLQVTRKGQLKLPWKQSQMRSV